MSVDAVRLTGVVLLAFSVLQQTGATQGAAVSDVAVRARCTTCHGIDLIQQQHLTRAGWERELDKMIRWGAVVGDDDRPLLLDYLQSQNASPAASSDSSRGAQIFRDRCITCHAADIVEQQRLTNAAWRREVDKMAGWGAKVDASEKDSLVVFLTERFGNH